MADGDMEAVGGKLSTFNEASYQMLRIHKLQEEINECNTNPLAFNIDRNLYNYEIIIHNTNSLFGEVSSKLEGTEKDKGLVIKNMLQTFMRENPIHETTKNPITHVEEMTFTKGNWLGLREQLFRYNLFVRDLLDKHKMTSPTGDRPEEAAYK